MSKYSPKEMLDHIKKEKLETRLAMAFYCNEKEYTPMFGEIKPVEDGLMYDIADRPGVLEDFMKKAFSCEYAATADETIVAELKEELDDDRVFKGAREDGVPVATVYELLKDKKYVKTCLVCSRDKFYMLADVWNEVTSEDVAARHLMERVLEDFITRNNIDTKGRLRAVLNTAGEQYKHFCDGVALGVRKGSMRVIK